MCTAVRAFSYPDGRQSANKKATQNRVAFFICGRRDMRLIHPWTARGCASYRCPKLLHAISSNPRPLPTAVRGFSNPDGRIRQTKKPPKVAWLFSLLARPEGFEPPTTWFEARYSIQLSYGRAEGPKFKQFVRQLPKNSTSVSLGG
jgi:hypothetical protein